VTFANGFALTAFFYSSFYSMAEYYGLDHKTKSTIASPAFAGFSTGLLMFYPLGIKTALKGSAVLATATCGLSHYAHSHKPSRNSTVVRGKAKF
jgi:hypothetical protein